MSATWPTMRWWRRFDKAEVRKALNMAINKQSILEAVFQGGRQGRQEPDSTNHVVLQQCRPG